MALLIQISITVPKYYPIELKMYVNVKQFFAYRKCLNKNLGDLIEYNKEHLSC